MLWSCARSLAGERRGWGGGGGQLVGKLLHSHAVNCCHNQCFAPSALSRSAFGIDLPPTVVFDYPTIDDLVSHLAAHVHGAPSTVAGSADEQSGSDPDTQSDSDSEGAQEGGGAGTTAASPEELQLAVRRSSSDREQEQPNTQLVPASLPGPLAPINKRAPRLTKPGYFTVRACKGGWAAGSSAGLPLDASCICVVRSYTACGRCLRSMHVWLTRGAAALCAGS